MQGSLKIMIISSVLYLCSNFDHKNLIGRTKSLRIVTLIDYPISPAEIII